MNRFILPFLLGVLCFCASHSTAQNRKPAKTPVKSAPFPWLAMGAGVGGLILGGALGSLRKKPGAGEVKVDPAAAFFDGMPLALALVDGKEKFTRHNAAFGRFFELASSGGAKFPEIFHPDDLVKARHHFSEIFDGERAEISFPSRFFGRDGAPFHAILHARKHGEKPKPDEILIALQDISPQIEAQRELEGAREAIRALYEVIASDSDDLSGKMRALLAMGCGRFELPIGVLGRFVGAGPSAGFETLFVQSGDRRVRPAMSIARGDTSVEAQLLGAKHWPNAKNFREFPFLARNDETAYLGAPVLVSGELFGMLAFAANSPRETDFGGADAELLQLMAEWVGGEIERDHARIALQTQQKALLEANAQLEALATHDALTGAKNRRAFDEKLSEEWSRATRYGTPLSLILMDVDKFKTFNDEFGHPAGDEVLKRVARVVMSLVRGTDFFARYGGEEFVLVLPNTDAEGALILAGRLREKIEKAPWKERAITVSAGVSSRSSQHKDAAQFVSHADNALYKSKENGRNRVTHADELPASSPENAPVAP